MINFQETSTSVNTEECYPYVTKSMSLIDQAGLTVKLHSMAAHFVRTVRKLS